MEATNTGNPSEAPVQEWSAVVAELDKGRFLSLDHHPSHYSTWLTTLNADGAPHVTAVGAAWDDGAFWFQTGDGTRKAKNIARDPRCVVSVSVDGFDVVVEGTAQKVTDPEVVARIAAVYSGRGGWPAEPDESGHGLTAPFNAPGLGPPPWYVYRVDATSATSVLTSGEEGGSTRWRF